MLDDYEGSTMSPPRSLNEGIQQHYARSDLGTAILAALADAGKDVNHLKPEDLAPVDEFHIRGRQATLELARAVDLDTTKQVLDVGSGVGGPSRSIAHEFGCRVTGIDLTDEYCRVATMLAERVALSHLVSYRPGDALNLPFPEETFDVVWTQHAAMNVSDKATMYREAHRVLKPSGVLAIYDILAGPAGQVLFPVPWARFPEMSFLVTPNQLRQLLEDTGFEISSWEDTTPAAREWFASLARNIQQSGLPPLGFHLLLGPDFQIMAQTQRRNLEEGRIELAQIVARKQ
jgi:ubiquinone/menaquinone biosynthesis C-methylase UbiE